MTQLLIWNTEYLRFSTRLQTKIYAILFGNNCYKTFFVYFAYVFKIFSFYAFDYKNENVQFCFAFTGYVSWDYRYHKIWKVYFHDTEAGLYPTSFWWVCHSDGYRICWHSSMFVLAKEQVRNPKTSCNLYSWWCFLSWKFQ